MKQHQHGPQRTLYLAVVLVTMVVATSCLSGAAAAAAAAAAPANRTTRNGRPNDQHHGAGTGTLNVELPALDMSMEDILRAWAFSRNMTITSTTTNNTLHGSNHNHHPDHDSHKAASDNATHAIAPPAAPHRIIFDKVNVQGEVDAKAGWAKLNLSLSVTVTGSEYEWVDIPLLQDGRTVIVSHQRRVRALRIPGRSEANLTAADALCKESYFGPMHPFLRRGGLLMREGCIAHVNMTLLVPVTATMLTRKLVKSRVTIPLPQVADTYGPSSHIALVIPHVQSECGTVSRPVHSVELVRGESDLAIAGSTVMPDHTLCQAGTTDSEVVFTWQAPTTRALAELRGGAIDDDDGNENDNSTATHGGESEDGPGDRAATAKQEVHVDGSIVAIVSEDAVHVEAVLEYEVVRGEAHTDTMHLLLPTDLHINEVSGNVDGSWELQPLRANDARFNATMAQQQQQQLQQQQQQDQASHKMSVLTVTRTDTAMPKFRIILRGEIPFMSGLQQANHTTFDVNTIRTGTHTLRVTRERGVFGLYRTSGVDVRPPADTKGLSTIDLRKGSSVLQAPGRAGYHFVSAYRILAASRAHARGIHVKKHTPVATLINCAVDEMLVLARPTGSSGTLVQVTLAVRNHDQEYLHMTFPRGGELWTVQNEGLPWEALIAEDNDENTTTTTTWKIPLMTRTDGLHDKESAVHQLITMTAFFPEDVLHMHEYNHTHTMQVPLPRLKDVRAMQIKTAVFVPKSPELNVTEPAEAVNSYRNANRLHWLSDALIRIILEKVADNEADGERKAAKLKMARAEKRIDKRRKYQHQDQDPSTVVTDEDLRRSDEGASMGFSGSKTVMPVAVRHGMPTLRNVAKWKAMYQQTDLAYTPQPVQFSYRSLSPEQVERLLAPPPPPPPPPPPSFWTRITTWA